MKSQLVVKFCGIDPSLIDEALEPDREKAKDESADENGNKGKEKGTRKKLNDGD